METINLLDENDFTREFNVKGKMIGIALQCKIGDLLYTKLMKCGNNKQLIYTQDLRGIGKTHKLIMYAKTRECNVVVDSPIRANNLRKEYGYEKIYGQYSIELRGLKDLVIDEGVDFGNSTDIVQEENIITGFTNKKASIIEKPSLKEKAIQTLKVDIDSLLDKLKVSLDNNNFSNYKMLINNLKDTIELMNTLEHPEKDNVQNYTVNVSNLEEIANFTLKKITDGLRINGMGI